jgi:hypothetical protein
VVVLEAVLVEEEVVEAEEGVGVVLVAVRVMAGASGQEAV